MVILSLGKEKKACVSFTEKRKYLMHICLDPYGLSPEMHKFHLTLLFEVFP